MTLLVDLNQISSLLSITTFLLKHNRCLKTDGLVLAQAFEFKGIRMSSNKNHYTRLYQSVKQNSEINNAIIYEKFGCIVLSICADTGRMRSGWLPTDVNSGYWRTDKATWRGMSGALWRIIKQSERDSKVCCTNCRLHSLMEKTLVWTMRLIITSIEGGFLTFP